MQCNLCGDAAEPVGSGRLPSGWYHATSGASGRPFCSDCSRLLATLDEGARAAARACLHVLAVEAGRVAEAYAFGPGPASLTEAAERRLARRVGAAIRTRHGAGVYRAACACVTCGEVRAGVRRKAASWADVPGFAAFAEAGPEVRLPPGARKESDADKAARIAVNRALTLSAEFRAPPAPGSLSYLAMAKRPRRESEWRSGKDHRFVTRGRTWADTLG